jgi:hypothetical protein
MITTVVNLQNSPYDVYIGRPSIFGNPYSMKSYTRKMCIELYKGYFKYKLNLPVFREEVLKLKGKTLGCYCKPLACHGDIILEWLNQN